MKRNKNFFAYMIEINANHDVGRGGKKSVANIKISQATAPDVRESRTKGYRSIWIYCSKVRKRPRREVIQLAIKALEAVLETGEPESEDSFWLKET